MDRKGLGTLGWVQVNGTNLDGWQRWDGPKGLFVCCMTDILIYKLFELSTERGHNSSVRFQEKKYIEQMCIKSTSNFAEYFWRQ